MAFSCHMPIFCVEAKQPTYLLKVYALRKEPPWNIYKREPPPLIQDTPFWREEEPKKDVVHLSRIWRV